MAQFVGHDRALKRLGLLTVGGIELDRTIDRSRLGAAPTLSPSTSVRDALAALLVADARAAAVVDGSNYLGAITLPAIGRMLRGDDAK